MEFIWVLVGVIFIIAMLSREGFFKFSERWLIIWMTIIVALVIGGCICKASTDNQNVIGAILGFAFQLGSIFFLLSLGVMLDVPEPPRKYSLHEIQSKFSQCGFNNIPLNKFTILIEDGYSPLKTFDLDSDGTVLKCYDWMFQKASWVIDNLSKKEVERRLGLAINDIPLDKSVPLDAALSKRGTLARDFLIQSNGLRYENLIRKTHISIADEYYSFFYDYVKKYSKTMDNTNCEDIQNQLSNNGYPVIASSSIKKLMEDPSSPLHDNHAAVDYCYDWMCEQATVEIDALSDDDIEKRLGVPLNEIPLDESVSVGESELKRTNHTKDYLLRRDGLKYSNKMMGEIDESEKYFNIFNDFVTRYIVGHSLEDTP